MFVCVHVLAFPSVLYFKVQGIRMSGWAGHTDACRHAPMYMHVHVHVCRCVCVHVCIGVYEYVCIKTSS